MGYRRKQGDKRRLKKLSNECSGFILGGSYYDKDKGCYVRLWKSQGRNSAYAYYKKKARRKVRRYIKKNGIYSKKVDDPRWNVW